ncbi:MAG: MBL fold metallo-hydrolase [Bacteroidota bacterium]|nr:MBL fold metallo-hydrolase [Bacteroidota bacterium]
MKITENIHLLKIDFSVQITPEKSLPRFVNSLIIFGESITVIDSGVKNSYRLIYDYIEKNNRKIGEIKTLILSHSHPDHIGSAKKIKMDTGCKVIGHLLEKDWIENIDLQFKNRPVPGFYSLVDESVKLDNLLTGGENLELDKGITISIINTPGHSKGSFSILFKEDSVLFTADSLPLANDIPTYDNYTDLKKSLSLLKSINDYQILLSSWTPPLSDKNEISKLIIDAENYLNKLDIAVKEYYLQDELNALDNCGKVINALGLPPVFVVSLVDRAFRTHL